METKTNKNYLLVTVEKRFIEPSGYSAGGYYNEHFVECTFQSKKACKRYQEMHSMWNAVIMTKRQFELSVETTGSHTV